MTMSVLPDGALPSAFRSSVQVDLRVDMAFQILELIMSDGHKYRLRGT